MRERGYPIDDFDQRAADISVDHPQVVENFRAGHSIYLSQEYGGVGTEEQRQAFVHYRELFEKLLETDKTRTRHRRHAHDNPGSADQDHRTDRGDVGQPTRDSKLPDGATDVPPGGTNRRARTVESAEAVESVDLPPLRRPFRPSRPVARPDRRPDAGAHAYAAARGTEESAERSLFAETSCSGFRSRWDDVQSSFVDDPKDCVHKADGLVSEVVEQLTNGFSEARSRLEAQWARGEEASTEDLRLALKRYRDFFQRLLSV